MLEHFVSYQIFTVQNLNLLW